MKKPIIIYNNIIPFEGYIAINLFGVIFARKEYKPLTKNTIIHEGVHSNQIISLLGVGFYLWYVIEYLIKLILHNGNTTKAYYDISFEREAYLVEEGKAEFKWYGFLRYL